MNTQESYWTTPDGVRLYQVDWRAEQPQAAAVLVHGLGEHCRRYDHVAWLFASSGISLYSFDLRGHGRSSGRRGHIPSLELVMDDLAHRIEQSAEENPHLPLFLYGHSMGGLIALSHALTREPDVRGVVVTCPGLAPAVPLPPAKLRLVRILRRIVPSLTVNNELASAYLSHDLTVNEAYRNDPLVSGKISTALAMDILEYGQRAIDRAADFRFPLLILQAMDDKLVSVASTRRFVERIKPEVLTYIEYQGKYHELHNEIGKEAIIAQMTSWIIDHAGLDD